jgi:hypothetical protein
MVGCRRCVLLVIKGKRDEFVSARMAQPKSTNQQTRYRFHHCFLLLETTTCGLVQSRLMEPESLFTFRCPRISLYLGRPQITSLRLVSASLAVVGYSSFQSGGAICQLVIFLRDCVSCSRLQAGQYVCLCQPNVDLICRPDILRVVTRNLSTFPMVSICAYPVYYHG